MDPNDILNAALNSGGKMIGGSSLFVLEGNVELNLFNVKTLDEVYFRNTADFAEGINNGWMSLGISSDKDELWNFSRAIERKDKSFEGNIYVSMTNFVLDGQPERNELRVIPMSEFFSNNNTAFANHINIGWLTLGIFSDFETADESKTYIRLLFRDEAGTNLLRKRFDDDQNKKG